MSGDDRRAASVAAVALDGGDLAVGGGLLSIVRPALAACEPGGVVAVLTSAASADQDLPSWCRAERHTHLGVETLPDGRRCHRIARGPHGVVEASREWGMRIPLRGGRCTAAEVLRAVPFPERADPATGFAPRGALVEPGGPVYPFDLVERDRVAAEEVAQLYDQAVSSQWDATRDIPWDTVRPLPVVLERAVGQVMTFLAENELSALYLPAKFVPRIHPAYAEVAMTLAIQMADEARHIDVFLKRARAAGGGVGVSSATTARSLLSLLLLEDFAEAEFLLSVLGEGTFLDLLRFVEEHAPDEATAELVRRARNDETRHVRFGLVHVKHALARDPSLFGRLEAAVRRRATTMAEAGGVPAPLQDALVVLAAGGTDPRGVAKGHRAFRELLDVMHANRVKRLVQAGMTDAQAAAISALHTPNFM